MARNKLILPAFANFAVRKISVLIIFIFSSCAVFCQEEELSDLILNIAEELAADESDPETATLFIEQLHELSDNPVRINSADMSEISRLFFITEFQIKALIDHVKESGNIVSNYEIASVPGFDRQIAELITPFIVLTEERNDNASSFRFRSNLLSNYIIKPGENDTSLSGSPWKVLTKYKFTAGKFSGGLTAEKDAGEKFLPDNNKLPDFFSVNLSYAGNGFIRKLIVGDYSACFGYGTNVNSRMRTGLSLTSSGYMSLREEVRPYTSTDENNFFRGVAAAFSTGNLGLNLLYSYNSIDATINLADDSAEMYVVNLYRSGLHTTPQLQLKRDVLNESFYGININYNTSHIRFGVTYTGSYFSVPLKLKSKNPEDLYGFEGTHNNVYSIYYNSITGRILLYGEVSADKELNLAIVQGLSSRLAERLSINMIYRYYSPEFNSFHANAPGANSSTGNEHGFLAGFTFEAAKYLFISAGCDISTFPWLKYRCSFPSLTKRKEIRIKYIPSENLSLEMMYNHRSSMTDLQNNTGVPGIAELTSGTFKSVVKYTLRENLQFATRVDLKLVEEDGSKGMLMLQDIKYRLQFIPLTIWFRYCIFSTDNWNSRLYTYENDLLYSFSIPALSGKGSRSYLMLKWEIGDMAELKVKYRLMSFKSAYNTAEESDAIKFQLRLWF